MQDLVWKYPEILLIPRSLWEAGPKDTYICFYKLRKKKRYYVYIAELYNQVM